MPIKLESLNQFDLAPFAAAIEDDIKKISRPIRLLLALGIPALLWAGLFFIAAHI